MPEELGRLVVSRISESEKNNSEIDYDFISTVKKSENTFIELIQGFFMIIFDSDYEENKDKFFAMFDQILSRGKINSLDVSMALSLYHIELVNIECDYPFMDTWYSEILLRMVEKDQVDFGLLDFIGEDPMPDIFAKIFMKMV